MNFSKIYRTQEINGVVIPAIIRNGSNYFVDLKVYEDGRVDCWNFEDFEHFKKDVESGWVSVNIPNEEEISVFELGNWEIDNGSWIYDKNSFIDYVWSIIKQLNPSLSNLYKYVPKKINGVSVSESGDGTLYKEKTNSNSFFNEKIKGEGVNLFLKNKDEYQLVRLDIYDENSIFISRIKQPFEITLAQLETMIENKEIISQPSIKTKITIFGLGSFEIKEELYSEKISNKLLEIKDIINTLKGEPSLVEVCRNAYQEYLNNPTETLKEKLKIAYENVPEHQSMYIGDMDTRDIAVRMIVYGEQEIENWSHYAVAEAMGEELPTIDIPIPKQE